MRGWSIAMLAERKAKTRLQIDGEIGMTLGMTVGMQIGVRRGAKKTKSMSWWKN